MKKKTAILLAALMLCLLTACGAGNGTDDAAASQPPQAAEADAGQQEEMPAEEAPAGETPVEEPAEEAAWEVTYQNVRTYSDSIGATWAQAIVEITNTGSKNLYLGSGAYDLEDAGGSMVAAQTMVSEYPSVLAPGEKGYMYDETILEDYSAGGELTIQPRPDVEEASVDLVRYAVTEVNIADDSYGGLKVTGRVENTTEETADGMVYIVAFFYDESGTPLGSAFTILTEEFPAGSKIGFELSAHSLPDDVTASAVADTVVYAYPLQMQF